MTIVIVDGAPRTGKSTIAAALKTHWLAQRSAALVLDGPAYDSSPNEEPRSDDKHGQAHWYLQRLLEENPFPPKGRPFTSARKAEGDDRDDPGDRMTKVNPDYDPGGLKEGQQYDVAALPWKRDVEIIVIGPEGLAMLQKMEAMVPGFRARFAPEYRVTTAFGG